MAPVRKVFIWGVFIPFVTLAAPHDALVHGSESGLLAYDFFDYEVGTILSSTGVDLAKGWSSGWEPHNDKIAQEAITADGFLEARGFVHPQGVRMDRSLKLPISTAHDGFFVGFGLEAAEYMRVGVRLLGLRETDCDFGFVGDLRDNGGAFFLTAPTFVLSTKEFRTKTFYVVVLRVWDRNRVTAWVFEPNKERIPKRQPPLEVAVVDHRHGGIGPAGVLLQDVRLEFTSVRGWPESRERAAVRFSHIVLATGWESAAGFLNEEGQNEE